MRGRDLGMLAGRTVAHGEAHGLVGDGPKLRANGRAVIVDPVGDPRRDVPGNPHGWSADACRCIREASPTAVAPDAWPVSAGAWGDRPVTGFRPNGLPGGAWWAYHGHTGRAGYAGMRVGA